jgi:hypothetical protein
MANKIQIKRSVANSVVTGLSNGELAFTQASNTLYIGAPDGSSGSIPIGTKLNYGTLTANSVLVANSTSAIDKIIVANAAINSIWANGSAGSAGQVLISGGSGSNLYWVSQGSLGVNVDSQYTWTNTQTFSNTITFDSTINGTANNANHLNGKSEADLNVNSASTALTSNNSNYAFGKSEADLNVNSASTALNANNASYLNNKSESDLNVNSAVTSTTANNSTYAFGKSEGDLNVNSASSALNANNASYLNNKSEADLNVNSASTATTANNSTYAFGKSEGDLNVNSASSALNANNASYLGGNTASDLRTYASDKAANAYSNAMSDTLSRNAIYTGNNEFSGANTTLSGANTQITGFLSTANANLSSIKLRGTQLQGGSYDRNTIDFSAGDKLTISGGNYGTQIRSANDGTSWFTLDLNPDTGALIPGANGTMNLGTTEKRFGTLYLAGSTIILGNTTLSSNGSALQVSDLVVVSNATISNIVGTSTSINSNVIITSTNVSMSSANLSVKDVTVSGNLTINGTLTTIDTNNLSVKDGVIKLADQNTTADTIDFGFYGLSGNSIATYYAGLYRDHAASSLTTPVFKLFTSNVEPTTTVDNTAPAYALGTLNAYLTTGAFVANSTAVNITANSTVSSTLIANSLTLTTALAANSGGTGQNSYTAGDLLYASDSSTLSKLAIPGSAANGQVLQIVNNLPAYGTLDGGSF